MSTFFLIRHGATDIMRERIAGRMAGVHLNATGRIEAERVAERLANDGIEGVYSGPLERAQETAMPLCQRLDLPLEIAPAFDEVDFGDWTGCSFRELESQPAWKRFNSFRSSAAPPGGELMLAVQLRAVAQLEQLRLRHRAVAVVSHGDVIRGLVAHFLGMHIDFLQRIEISPASVTIFGLEDWGAQFRLVNGTSSGLTVR